MFIPALELHNIVEVLCLSIEMMITVVPKVMTYGYKGVTSSYFSDAVDLLFKAVYLSIILHLLIISKN